MDEQGSRPPVRILFLNSPESFGADTWIHGLLLRHLDRGRFELHAACPPDTKSFAALSAIEGVRVRPTRFGPSLTSGAGRLEKIAEAARLLPAMAGLAAYIRKHDIRILHASDRPRDAVACAALARITGASALIHLHVKCDDWIGGAVRWAFRRADALVGISAFVSRSLTDRGYRAGRVHTVLNSIDPSQWDPDTDPAPVRRELGIAQDAPVISCISRLFHWKGHRELLRAFAKVRAALPEARLLLVGAEDVLAGTPHYTRELEQLAAELGLGQSVRFTGPRADVARMYAAGDVFALPSFEEPFGLVFAEAMAMRRPVVALDNGGTPEVVEHGRTGLLSPPADVDALAGNLLALLRDPERRARMGAAGRARVEALFAPARMAVDMSAVYERVLRGEPAKPSLTR